MGLREDFLKRAAVRKLHEFQTDAGTVYLRSTNNAVRSKIDSMIAKENKTPKDCSDLRWFALRECMVDESGDPILSVNEKSLYDTWDTSFTEPIFDEILRITRFTDDERDEAKKN